MKYCVINKETGICTNTIMLDSIDQFTETEELILAPNNDGEIGWIWENNSWTNPNTLTIEQIATRQRQFRNSALRKHCDLMNPMRWESMTPEQQQTWKDFRQTLLDLPDQPGWPTDIVWPTVPQFN